MRLFSLLSNSATPLRAQLALMGALAFYAVYWMIEVGDKLLPLLPFLLLFSFIGVTSFGALAMSGPLRVLHAVGTALGLGAVVTALLWSASLTVSGPEALFDDPYNVIALIMLSTVSVPFLIAWHEGDPLDYETLFNSAWEIVVRGAAGLVFVGVYWLTLWLSHTLLQLVGVDVLEVLIETEWLAATLSGAVLGLALAVVTELSDVISHSLILRLLRLVMPPLAAVAVVFLGAAVINGLDEVFRSFSATVTLLSMAGVSTLLITSALADTDAEAAIHPVLVRAAQVLALSLPVMAGLAAWAVWLRVDQYGLTPERIAAAVVTMWVLGYGVLYGLSVLGGARWQDRVRRANTAMALAGLALSALWISPLLNVNALSAQAQLARFEAGRTAPEALPLWELAHDWGPSGEAALMQLRAQAGADADLARAIAALDASGSRWDFARSITGADADSQANLEAAIAVSNLPRGAVLGLEQGHRMIVAELCLDEPCMAIADADGWIILGFNGATLEAHRLRSGAPSSLQRIQLRDENFSAIRFRKDILDAARTGGATVGAVDVPALIVGDNVLILME